MHQEDNSHDGCKGPSWTNRDYPNLSTQVVPISSDQCKAECKRRAWCNYFAPGIADAAEGNLWNIAKANCRLYSTYAGAPSDTRWKVYKLDRDDPAQAFRPQPLEKVCEGADATAGWSRLFRQEQYVQEADLQVHTAGGDVPARDVPGEIMCHDERRYEILNHHLAIF
jgi:hypothetical protein